MLAQYLVLYRDKGTRVWKHSIAKNNPLDPPFFATQRDLGYVKGPHVRAISVLLSLRASHDARTVVLPLLQSSISDVDLAQHTYSADCYDVQAHSILTVAVPSLALLLRTGS